MKEFFDNNSYWIVLIFIPALSGLFSWLGKVWSERIARKEDADIRTSFLQKERELNEKMDDMKREWDQDMRFLTAQLDNSKLVFKLRFEHLYEDYLKISEQIYRCRELCLQIMILETQEFEISEHVSPKPDIKKITNEFNELSIKLQRYLLSNIPFINEEVYKRSVVLVDIMIALVDFERISPLHREQFSSVQEWHDNKTIEIYYGCEKALSGMLSSIGDFIKKDIENHSILNQEKHQNNTVSNKPTSQD